MTNEREASPPSPPRPEASGQHKKMQFTGRIPGNNKKPSFSAVMRLRRRVHPTAIYVMEALMRLSLRRRSNDRKRQSRSRSTDYLISIFFAFASSFFGSVTVSTPFL